MAIKLREQYTLTRIAYAVESRKTVYKISKSNTLAMRHQRGVWCKVRAIFRWTYSLNFVSVSVLKVLSIFKKLKVISADITTLGVADYNFPGHLVSWNICIFSGIATFTMVIFMIVSCL